MIFKQNREKKICQCCPGLNKNSYKKTLEDNVNKVYCLY